MNYIPNHHTLILDYIGIASFTVSLAANAGTLPVTPERNLLYIRIVSSQCINPLDFFYLDEWEHFLGKQLYHFLPHFLKATRVKQILLTERQVGFLGRSCFRPPLHNDRLDISEIF